MTKQLTACRSVRHPTYSGPLIPGSPRAWAVYDEKRRVACIEDTLGVPWDEDKEAEALAHLFAAAPDMLAALKDMLGDRPWLQQGTCIHCGREYPDEPEIIEKGCADDCHGEMARVAIAKAEGRS